MHSCFPFSNEVLFGFVFISCLFDCYKWYNNWRMHWILANLISEWHCAALCDCMKKKGIKFCHKPCALSGLLSFPAKFLVLSAILLLPNAIGLHTPCSNNFKVPWSEAAGHIRSLYHPKFFPTPTRPFTLRPPLTASQLLAREGENTEVADCNQATEMPKPEPLSPNDAAEWEGFTFNKMANLPCACNTCSPIDELIPAVCLLMKQSFGQLGLLAGNATMDEVIVDTGASLTISPHQSDFVDYQTLSGKVIDGLVAGSEIAGVGTIIWNIECEGKMIQLSLRALHVPGSKYRLLCPQQVKKEHKPGIPAPAIEDDYISFQFPEGEVRCPYNESNLPSLQIQLPNETNNNMKSLNACIIQEANQNLTIPQKELLKWHCKLGHLDMN